MIVRCLALAAAALLVAPAASAQDVVEARNAAKAIDEAAADLAFGYCPLYLGGQLKLPGAPELKGLGFGTTLQKTANARFGEMQTVAAVRPDGVITFGGVPDKVCSVVVTGPKRAEVLAMLHKNMAFMGFDFKPDPANTGDRAGMMLETFKAPVGGQFVNLQLIDGGKMATPAIVAQLFVTTE